MIIKHHFEGVWKGLYLDVKKAINDFYDSNNRYISVKKIRKYLGIDNSDRSKINGIWRIFEHFEREGYLVRINKKYPKQYKISKFPIQNNITFVDGPIGV